MSCVGAGIDEGIEAGIEQQAQRAMRSAAEVFDSLYQLALLFVNYFDRMEEDKDWRHMMLQDAKHKTFKALPHYDRNPWNKLKVKARAAFETYPGPRGLALQYVFLPAFCCCCFCGAAYSMPL